MTPAASPAHASLDVSSAEARRRLRAVLGSFATGVTVVTTVDAGNVDVGLTVNSFTSVSLDPPLVLWCVGRHASVADAFARSEFFAVNVLAASQRELALTFADRSTDKFRGVELDRGAGNIPLLRGCIARLQCTTREVLEGGDHLILLGEIVRLDERADDALLFHRGRFSRLSTNVENGGEGT